MALTTIDDRGLKTPIDLLDNEKIRFGTGNDLEIYHNASNSLIENTTGNLIIKDTTGNVYVQSAGIYFQDDTTNENIARFIADGACELYYNNSKKFETTDIGVQATGHIFSTTKFRGNDDVKVSLGTSEDLQIYHNATNSYLDNATGGLYIRNTDAGGNSGDIFIQPNNAEHGIWAKKDGAIELYYDGSKKFETTSAGVLVTGYLKVQTSSTTDSALRLTDVGVANYDFTFPDTSTIKLGTDTGSTKQLQLSNAGAGHFDLLLADNGKIKVGDSDDLQLYHNGTNSFIENGTGELLIRAKTGENSINCNPDGAVELYYDNAKKFETNSGGASVTGGLNVSGNLHCTADGGKIISGAGDDLQIYHDGSDSFITNATGYQYLKANNLSITSATGTESMISGAHNGAVELYYDNVKKFATQANGVTVFGSEGLKLYSENGNNSDTNSVVWRGGSNSQQANLVKMHARQVSDWGGEFQLKIKKNDGSLSDNYATVLNAKGDSNGYIQLCTDSTARFQATSTGFKAGAVIPGDHATGGLIINSGGESSLYRSSDGIAFIIGGPQSGQKLVEFRHVGTGIGNISKSGTTAITFNTTNSDRTLKKNFEDWTDSYWTGFKDLKPQKFNFLFQEDSDPKLKGYIAQDLASTFPEAYPKDAETDKYMFNPSGMVPYLMKTLQEAITKIETLETEVAALKAK